MNKTYVHHFNSSLRSVANS